MTLVKHRGWLRPIALACAVALVPGDVPLVAQQPPAAGTPTEKPKTKSPDQLDSLVAPIALYPDPLLAQILAATTYPLEIVQAARWVKANPKLKGEELTKNAAKQGWDASVAALVAFPDALKLLDTNIQWTQDLGNAFLDQQTEVMDAVQRMRKKAKDGGKLQSTKEQKVEVKTVETKTVIEIQPSNPQVIYVPTYDPVVVYGAAPVYAYPPVTYPWGAVAATAAVSFGVGVMMGAMWGGCCGGGYGWGCSWGGTANININNNFNTRYGYNNINGGNRTQINGGNRNNIGSGNSSWQHNPEHRRSVPYNNRDTAQRFGGSNRDSAGRNERFDGRSNQNNRGSGRDSGGLGRDSGGPGRDSSGLGRDSGANRAQSRDSQDRVGNRDVGGGNRSNSAFGGGDRSRTEAASNRGFSSSRQSRSGGGGGGGGSRSGGMSRGGGRRR